jgi:glycosyltransferase 2 family protein
MGPSLAQLRSAPLERVQLGHLGGIAAAAAGLGATWAALERATDRLVDGEADAFDALNSLPDGLHVPAWPVMQLGNFWVCVAGSVGAYAIWRRPAPAIAVGTSTLGAWGAAKAVKAVVGRGRPSHYFAGARIRQRGLSGDGFVSGHACVAFALATALTPWVPRSVAVGGFALAGAVGAARVYVGAHLPLDVAGGAAIGIGCGMLADAVVGVPRPRRG